MLEMKVLPLKDQTIEALILNFQATGDNAVFGEVYTRYYSKLFAYCKRITGNREDAYDSTTITFIKAAEKINKLNSAKNFPSWLFRIGYNSCIDNRRANQKNRVANLDDYNNITYDLSQIERRLEKEDRLTQMEGWMDQLRPMDKEILVERYMIGKSMKELEMHYHISSSAVKMRLSRARSKMAQLAQ